MKLVIFLLVAGVSIAALGAFLFRSSAGDFTRSDVDRIIAACNAPADRMVLHRGWITVSESLDNDIVGACIMRELRRSGKKSIQIVANQLHTSDDHN